MGVRLVSLSNSFTTGISSAEDLIVYCARVSNPTNQLNTETGPKLINYLIKHKHWSPFEMVSMTVEIKTTRAIAAQILRHRSFSFQEFSQRYSTATQIEEFELRKQGKTNRQVGDDPVNNFEYIDLINEINLLQQQGLDLYNRLIDKGIAKECARMVLPLNTQTTLYMAGTIRSWIHYISVRATEDTQKEHRLIAEEIKQLFIKHFPIISKALEYNNANISSVPVF
jgi:thymidylate synthase (FAD)